MCVCVGKEGKEKEIVVEEDTLYTSRTFLTTVPMEIHTHSTVRLTYITVVRK